MVEGEEFEAHARGNLPRTAGPGTTRAQSQRNTATSPHATHDGDAAVVMRT